jgi:murein DD-endopeptidase MepM/ murein hydrolase activator NlpD
VLQGKGMYIWQVQNADGGDPSRLVALAREAGLTHVIFKLTDGTFDFPLPAQDPGGRYELMTDRAIRAFQTAGIQVWALTHTQGRDPAMEAHRAASRVLRWNLSGLVVNPQSQYIGQFNRARLFMSTLRQDLASLTASETNPLLIAFSLFRDPDAQDPPTWPQSRRFPIDEFTAQSDLLMPPVFWIARDGGDPAAALRENFDEYQRRYPDKPYVPTGAAFGERYGSVEWTATPQQIELFLNQVRALDLPAVNFWSWQHARSDSKNPRFNGSQLWDAVANYPWQVGDAGSDPPPPSTGDGDPFADGVEIVPPGAGRYIDGIYSGFNTIRFDTMRSSQGPVKYAQTHPTRSTLWAQWVPGITKNGRYEIAVFVPGTHATTHRARYHIRGVVGQDTTVVVELDQNRYYDRYVPLGVFELDASRPDSGAVNLTNLTGETGREIAFSPIRWMGVSGEGSQTRLADGYDAPVGTVQERAGDALWPANWIDANPYGRRFADSLGTSALHTGADLNLNVPRWDADRGAPVYAIASGMVVFAARMNTWGRVIVIRHDPLEQDGNPVWARYAHVDELQVRLGEVVQRGQQIAVVGKPEPTNAPYHLHFDICISGIVAQTPGHWPGLNYQALAKHYVNPLTFIKARRPPAHLRGR